MRRRWPKTKFSVSVATCTDVRERIRDGIFDLGFLIEASDRQPKYNPTSVSKASDRRRVIAPIVPLVIFAAPTRPLAKDAARAPIRRSALDSFPLFVSDAGGDFTHF